MRRLGRRPPPTPLNASRIPSHVFLSDMLPKFPRRGKPQEETVTRQWSLGRASIVNRKVNGRVESVVSFGGLTNDCGLERPLFSVGFHAIPWLWSKWILLPETRRLQAPSADVEVEGGEGRPRLLINLDMVQAAGMAYN